MSAPLLTITAYGLPAPQGSKRHLGRGVMVESSKRVKPWRDDVKAAAERFIESQRVRGLGWTPLDAPLVVSMVFTMPKPASAPKRRRTWPMRTPDLSKLIRSTEDALTDAGIWRDDARVVRYHDTGKAYPGEDALALTSPGVVIRIWPLEQPTPSTETDACRSGDCASCGLGNIHHPCSHDCHTEQARPVVAPPVATEAPCFNCGQRESDHVDGRCSRYQPNDPEVARPVVAPYLPAAATPEGIEDIALPGLEAAR